MNALRPLLGLLLLGACAWFALGLFGSGGTSGAPVVFTDSASCAQCHQAAYSEWQGGQHSTSWTGDAVRELSNDFSNQDCIDCHAPAPVFSTGIGERVLPRTLNRVDGVDCITCHALLGGGVAASFTDPSVPCGPVERTELLSVEHCVGCHNQHQTVDQWRSSRWAEQRITCIDCHMPFRDGDPSKGRLHGMHGGSSIANLKSATELRGAAEEGAWVLELENVGAGHSFPADERSRTADLFWRPLDSSAEESAPWTHLHRFRSPYRHEVDIPDTLLQVHESRRIVVQTFPNSEPGEMYHDLEQGLPVEGPIEVALFYKRSPFYLDLTDPSAEADAVLVHTLELRP